MCGRAELWPQRPGKDRPPVESPSHVLPAFHALQAHLPPRPPQQLHEGSTAAERCPGARLACSARAARRCCSSCGPTAELASGGCNSHSVLGKGHSTAVGKSPTPVPTLATPCCARPLLRPQLSLGVRLHIPPCSQRLPLVPCFYGSTPVRTCTLHCRGLCRHCPPPKPPRAV